MATQEGAKAFALALPEAHQDSHQGRPDLRVRNKIFATLPPDGSLVLKTTPETFDALMKIDGETFSKVWGERWIGVDVSRLTDEHLAELIADAWKLAATKTLVREYEANAEG